MPIVQSRTSIRLFCLLVVICVAEGCRDSDLTSSPKYANVIGSEYKTKTALYALGVYGDINKKEVTLVSISPVRQTGPEIAFEREMPVGQVVRVLKVRKRFMPFENGYEFIVSVDGLALPTVEVVIPLYGYMETSDGFLDPSRFERVRPPR